MTNQQFYQDATVYDAAGEKIGTVHEYDPQGGYITVQKGFLFHKDLYIPVSAVQSTDADGNVYLSLSKDDLAGDRYANPPAGGTAADSYAQGATVTETTTTRVQAAPQPARRQDQPTAQTGDNINVPVYEEELVAGKRQEQIGDVRLHKDVVTEQETVPVTLRREEVTVERVPVQGQTVDPSAARDAFQNEDIDVPVMGEEAVVGKQTREVEEVRLRKQGVTEQQQVSGTVRKERVIVDGADEDTTGRQ